jgi:hypothetical protein
MIPFPIVREETPNVMQHHSEPVTPAEAQAGRCHLCHRRLMAHPLARVQDVLRLDNPWGPGLVHRSCAVLGGIIRPTERRPRVDRHSAARA